MPKVNVYNQQGNVVRDIELDNAVFGVTPKKTILHDVVTSMRSNARRNTAHTKTKDEVRGGGRKPWRQKGTGRARHGSTRSPIWRGGGITFGPRTERNFARKINKKVRQLALKMVLSDKVAHDRFVLVDSLEIPEAKTKGANALLRALPLDMKKRRGVLVVSQAGDVIDRACRNLPSVRAVRVDTLNTLDVLTYHTILTTEDIAKTVEGRLK